MKRRILLTGFALAPALTLLGCSKSAETGNGYKEIKLGTLSGPHAEIAEVAVKLAANDGLKVKIVEFSDYVSPNLALDAGEVDANYYQHKPFFGCRCRAPPSENRFRRADSHSSDGGLLQEGEENHGSCRRRFRYDSQ